MKKTHNFFRLVHRWLTEELTPGHLSRIHHLQTKLTFLRFKYTLETVCYLESIPIAQQIYKHTITM